ncbi:MAG: flagellar hook-basal body complex protein [Roseibium sp.]|nr:flagellar hook-basal body complex protein [Roseibium sp.]
MGIYGAINSAVSGLAAQATALENISGNVANSQTTGFKRLDTTFSDLVAGGGDTQASQVAGTTYATSRATNTIQGDIAANDVSTYIAINGEGYFVVTAADDIVDGSTTFEDASFYTRGGDFELDSEGYLVNGSGYYLKGFQLDATTGNPIGDQPEVIQISSQPLPAQASSQIAYQANLPPTPQTSNYVTASDDLLDTSGTITATNHILIADQTAFINSSISGGSTTIYDANGSSINVELRWAKTAADTWNLYYASDGDATDSYKLIGQADFDAAGQINSLAVPGDAGVDGNTFSGTNTFTVATIAVDGITATGIDISFANGSLTQFASSSGNATSVSVDGDGYAAGELVGISIDESGRINAAYSNSQTRALYEIPLATFEAEQNLQRVDGAAFAATPTSGEPDLTGGGSIIANALELSNADIASEFSKLIITQQAYSANSRIVTTADEMLDDALNMVR